jgi:hypothetical protein
MNMCNGSGNVRRVGSILALALALQLTGCPCPLHWPIAKDVFTTAEQQILPIGLAPGTPQINPAEVPLYDQYGYSAWQTGAGTNYSLDPNNPQPYDKRTELAPSYTGAPNSASLLSFFAMTDIHIADEESPAQPLYIGWSAAYPLLRPIHRSFSRRSKSSMPPSRQSTHYTNDRRSISASRSAMIPTTASITNSDGLSMSWTASSSPPAPAPMTAHAA